MKLYYETVDADLNSTALHEAAYGLLRRALEKDWGYPEAKTEKNGAGKPFLPERPDLHISVSHTKGLVCCAVSERPVGVDCETYREVSLRAAERVCTKGELEYLRAEKTPCARFLTLWTLKESISKLRGVGLRESFKQYEITFEDGNPVCKGYTLHTQCVDGFFISAAE